MKLGLIVEGDGDVEAMPILLRSIFHSLECFNVQFEPPVRLGEFNNLIRGKKFGPFLQMLLNDDDIDGIIVSCDLDDGCPIEARDALIDFIVQKNHNIEKPVSVVLFNREFEALFLSQIDILMRKKGLSANDDDTADAIARCHLIRGAKEHLRKFIREPSYKESRDQGSLAALLEVDLLGSRLITSS